MLKRIRAFFSPPVCPDDEDKTRTAWVLYVLLANTMASVALIVIGTIFIFVQKTISIILLFILSAGILVSCALAQLGRVRFATALFVAGLWVVFSFALVLNGRLNTTSSAWHIALAVIAGILL